MSYTTRYWIDGRGWAEATAITFSGPQADISLIGEGHLQREIPTYASGLEADGPIGPHRCPRCRQMHRDPTIVCAVCREKQTARRHSGAAYYNENDPKAAAWLRELIEEGLIADGEVDDRSIADVRPGDLRGFEQCHFFAGIGGWSYALRLAGWPDDRAVWTGSCPCQPFSSAGKGAGTDDSRDLWPTWFQLIAECRPDVVFGEQVASADGLGWIDRVSADLEGACYALGAVDLCAAGIGAPHMRQRLWFVAKSHGEQLRTTRSGGVGSASSVAEGKARQRQRLRPDARQRGEAGALDHAERERAERAARSEGRAEREAPSGGKDERRGQLQTVNAGATRGFWGDAEWVACSDGKSRPVEPGTFPLAYGVPTRVGRLRGYGNAIVPQVAAEVIAAYMEITA